MKNMLSDIQIFLGESSFLLVVYAVYALAVCGVAFFIESRSQTVAPYIFNLIVVNAAHWIIAVIFISISMFIAGWSSILFGSEQVTAIIVTLISFFVLLLWKLYLINAVKLQISSQIMDCVLSSMILLLPYILFHIYVFLLASDWNH